MAQMSCYFRIVYCTLDPAYNEFGYNHRFRDSRPTNRVSRTAVCKSKVTTTTFYSSSITTVIKSLMSNEHPLIESLLPTAFRRMRKAMFVQVCLFKLDEMPVQ